MRASLLFNAARALREGRLGDAAVFKAVALTATPFSQALRAVNALAEPLPEFSGLRTTATAEGTLGHAYAGFLSKHRIQPLSISARVRHEVAPLNIVAARYVLVHDVFHVLLGFDISLPGELAIWSFVAAQRYSSTYGKAAALARALYPIAQPSAYNELKRQRTQALALAEQCPCLIGQPLEQYWPRPLAEVRSQLGILEAHDA